VNSQKKVVTLGFIGSNGKPSLYRDNMLPKELKFGKDGYDDDHYNDHHYSNNHYDDNHYETKEDNTQAQIKHPGTNFLLLSLSLL
jgi:hypothetical protein